MAAPSAIRYPMLDEEMNAFLKAAFGVQNCSIKAQALFDAANSAAPTAWASVRAELNLDFQPALELQLALSKAVKEASKAGKKKATLNKKQEEVTFDEDGKKVVMVNGVRIINGICVDPKKPADPKKATKTMFSFADMMTASRGVGKSRVSDDAPPSKFNLVVQMPKSGWNFRQDFDRISKEEFKTVRTFLGCAEPLPGEELSVVPGAFELTPTEARFEIKR
jgi:hypothetical protein